MVFTRCNWGQNTTFDTKFVYLLNCQAVLLALEVQLGPKCRGWKRNKERTTFIENVLRKKHFRDQVI